MTTLHLPGSAVPQDRGGVTAKRLPQRPKCLKSFGPRCRQGETIAAQGDAEILVTARGRAALPRTGFGWEAGDETPRCLFRIVQMPEERRGLVIKGSF